MSMPLHEKAHMSSVAIAIRVEVGQADNWRRSNLGNEEPYFVRCTGQSGTSDRYTR